jgi:hypothetical protein
MPNYKMSLLSAEMLECVSRNCRCTVAQRGKWKQLESCDFNQFRDRLHFSIFPPLYGQFPIASDFHGQLPDRRVE